MAADQENPRHANSCTRLQWRHRRRLENLCALLIDNDVLIDAGTGIGDLALDEIDPIRHVFLTHAHLDHVAGLPMLVDRHFRRKFRAVPLTVYAREETLRAVQEHIFNDVIWPDFARLPSGRKTDAAASRSAAPATTVDGR